MTMPPAPGEAEFVYIGAFVDELHRSGVRHVCISPGSRSTPLALTIARHPGLRTWMHLDERSCGFFALGMARMLGEPVAVLCTSGTAAANFLPAVVEARSAGVPLLVLTADRPPELRDIGAAQTIDQNRLYGAHAKWFVDVALPDTGAELLRYIRTLACRAVARSRTSPPGPIHLNFPFREPLVPVPLDLPGDLGPVDALTWHGRDDGEPWVRVIEGSNSIHEGEAQRLATVIRDARSPVIVCGPQFNSGLAVPLAELAARIGAPLLADPLSQLRWGNHDRSAIVDRYDAILRDDTIAASLVPDLVIRIGGVPTSKALLQYLRRHGAVPLVLIDADRWPDPTLLASLMIHSEPSEICTTIEEIFDDEGGLGQRDTEWLSRWIALDDAANGALDAYTSSLDEPFEGRAVADVIAGLPPSATLFVSSSMPVRDLDAFGRGDARTIRVLANRGANGIDGVVSSALGAAAVRPEGSGPLVLIIGDIALYHDMNGLLAARLHSLDATIILLNNDGGGIFSFLPQAADQAHFETLFGTPHGLDFRPAAELYGARYLRVGNAVEFRAAVAHGVASRGLQLIELRTDRQRNVALHEEAWRAVAAGVRPH